MSDFDVTRQHELSTYKWQVDRLDDLRDRVSDLYAIGATGREYVNAASGQSLEVQILSDDLWPKPEKKRRESWTIPVRALWLIVVMVFLTSVSIGIVVGGFLWG